MFSTEIVTSDKKVDEVRKEAAENRECDDEPVSKEKEVRRYKRRDETGKKMKDNREMGKGNEGENVNIIDEDIEHQVHSINRGVLLTERNRDSSQQLVSANPDPQPIS